MPTPTKGPRIGGSASHQRHILANLATALFEHGRITTTHSKAKALRPYAEKLITFAVRGDLAARRQVLTKIRDTSVVHTLFAEIGPRYTNRPGGYTRITKIGPRKGDNAPMAQIELVEALTISQKAVGEAEGATKRSAKDRVKPAPVAAPVVTQQTEVEAAEAEVVEAEVVEAEVVEAETVAEVPVTSEADEVADTETETVSEKAVAPEADHPGDKA